MSESVRSRSNAANALRPATLALAAFCLTLVTFDASPSHSAEQSYLVVANRDDGLPDGLAEEIKDAGGVLTGAMPQIGVAVAESDDPDFSTNAMTIAGVRGVVPNLMLGLTQPAGTSMLDADVALDLHADPAADPDPLSFLQWNLPAIDVPEAWSAGATGAGVRVAVLDAGFFMEHPDLAPNMNLELSTSFVPFEPVNFVYPNDAGLSFSHGSHVAGIVAAADNGIGVVGVAPDAEIVGVKVLSDNFGGFGAFEWILQGVIYAADIEADVINMSLGAFFRRSGYVVLGPDVEIFIGARAVNESLTILSRAFNYAHQRGSTIVVAAGNAGIDGDADADTVMAPGQLTQTISISATGPLGLGPDPAADPDTPAFYTNFGQSAIDLAAPGGNLDFDLVDSGDLCGPIPCFLYDTVLSVGFDPDVPDHVGWSFAIGTSMAAPHVSGTAALIIGANGGDMHPSQVRSILTQSADDLGKPGRDDFYGRGRVNAGNVFAW